VKATWALGELGGRGWESSLVYLGVAPSAFELCVRWRSQKLDGGLFGGYDDDLDEEPRQAASEAAAG
jgi:hypothetical protein